MHEPMHRSLPVLREIVESLAFGNPSIDFYRFRGIFLRFLQISKNLEFPVFDRRLEKLSSSFSKILFILRLNVINFMY